MQAFAELLDLLSTTPSRNGKLVLLLRYFRETPDPDRGWALAALTDGLPLRLPLRRVLAELMAARIDRVLYKLSRDYVGDTAETVALLWDHAQPFPSWGDDPEQSTGAKTSPSLDDIVSAIRAAPPKALAPVLGGFLDALDARGRWALLKLIGGAPRVGVSARLARTAIADMSDKTVEEIEEVWHGVDAPYFDLFAWLERGAPKPDAMGRPMFRPLMLAHPIENADWSALSPGEIAAEWKWDGIRVQIAATQRDARIYSRTGDDVSPTFPEIRSGFLGHHVSADGELLVMRDGVVAPFNDLQQRLNRKMPSAKQLREFPAHVRLYDILFDAEQDLRSLPFVERRQHLEAWFERHKPPLTDISTIVPFATFEELNTVWGGTREAGIEGLMLKRTSSPYLAGRPKGHWYKWKRSALTLDCVLMYAQRGSGKRSSFYSDYTFGVWRDAGDGTRQLVPVGKAYSGFTDAELKELDRFIRANTVETFGPVRAIAPSLVFEVAFDAVQRSARHKSGVAMRFPRIYRIRWDKPAEEADTLESVVSLIA